MKTICKTCHSRRRNLALMLLAAAAVDVAARTPKRGQCTAASRSRSLSSTWRPARSGHPLHRSAGNRPVWSCTSQLALPLPPH